MSSSISSMNNQSQLPRRDKRQQRKEEKRQQRKQEKRQQRKQEKRQQRKQEKRQQRKQEKRQQKKQQKKQFNELSSKYTFWVQQLQRIKAQSYGSGLKQLITIQNIQQFWEIFQFFKKTNELPINCDIYMFKEGIKPQWQDKCNIGGGCFKIKIQKSKSNKLWQNGVFSIVSPNNRLVNTINGIRIKIKQKFDQVQIWLNNSANEKEKLDNVKLYLKQNLQLTEQRIFNFYPFK